MIVLFYLVLVLLVALLVKLKKEEYELLNKLSWLPILSGGYPILGNTLLLSKNPKGYLQVFDKVTKESKCGTTVIPVFKSAAICTINADFFEYVLSSTELVIKADAYKFFVRWLGTSLITGSGDKWKSRRRLLTPTFHKTVMESYIEIMDKNANQFVGDLKEKIGNESFDIYPFVHLCTLSVVFETMMGLSLNDQTLDEIKSKSTYLELLDDVCDLASSRIFSLYKGVDFIHSFTNDGKKEKKFINILHEITNKIIIKKREQLKKNEAEEHYDDFNVENTGPKKAFLDYLLELKVDGKPLSDEEIREHVDTFMFAGHDTTAAGIAFTLYCLSRHPEIQEKAFEEQKQLFENDKNREITNTDLKNMVYLDLVIKESLRLYPSVPFIARKVHKDSNYKGNIIPKGTFILLYIFGIHRNPKYFENPEQFIPERFEKLNLKQQFAYIPFGSGVRGCMGKQYTFLEMKCVLARFLQNYQILPPNPENDIKLFGQTVIKSSTGVHCGLKLREWK